MDLITVEGVVLPSPSTYVTGFQDFSNLERNARATMIGEFIARKVKIQMSWNIIEEDNLSIILNAIDPMFFSVTYWDQKDKIYKTGTFYKGDRTAPLLNRAGTVKAYKDFAFNIIER